MAKRVPYWQKYHSAERSFTIAAGLSVLNKSVANQRLKEVNRELVTELNVLKEEIAKSKAEIRQLENENVRTKNEIARLERQKRAKLSRHPVRTTVCGVVLPVSYVAFVIANRLSHRAV
ncbi:hypothetical protein TTRE_0000700001 [Trichuris trichiura]|uniref:Uncharacterized protein n=1 Tax=Trichuris trichiura TaxID=36087 RepID=A0A077ZJE9_TRITR|nr:hypothetical protein TTRE_0000700001 [Trichuris trichiura]